MESEQLLPGILDEITLDRITPKLPWNEFHVLTSLNRSWHNAVRNHRVYEARVRSRSTETFLLSMFTEGPVLYGLRDKSIVKLPPIPPRLYGEILRPPGSIAVDGKLYVLGGEYEKESDKVCVLDLVGRRQWTQCASMQEPRTLITCGALGGKIYVFGVDDSSNKNSCKSVVYDLQKNTWSPIKPMLSPRSAFRIAVMGGEFVIYDGFSEDSKGNFNMINVLEFYHPNKDEWRVEEHIPWRGGTTQFRNFTAQGKFHFMDHFGIYVYNFDENSWTRLHSNSFTAVKGVDSFKFMVYAVVAVDNELFATAAFSNIDDGDKETCYLRGKGFGTEKEEIAWEEEDWIRDGWNGLSTLCPIYL